MWLRVLRRFEWQDGIRNVGDVYESSDFIGSYLVGAEYAEETPMPADLVQSFMRRLQKPQQALFLPFIGEFGHQLAYHVRLVQFHQASEKIVCCRDGLQALYPSATGFDTDWHDPLSDAQRAGAGDYLKWPDLNGRHATLTPVQAAGLTPREEWDKSFVIEPNKPIPFAPRRRGLQVDVCIGTRARAFAPEKNWQHAQRVADWCTANGLTFAVIGTRSSSYPLGGMTCMSGDHGDVDAAIELLQGCHVFVGTDSGSAHLAATVGARMIVQAVPNARCYTDRMALINPGRVCEVDVEEWNSPVAMIDLLNACMESRCSTSK